MTTKLNFSFDWHTTTAGKGRQHEYPRGNLGSWFDSRLSKSKHITRSAGSSFFYLYNIRRIRNYLSQTPATTYRMLVQD
ncbi:unnamed protein product [Porites evermanni]|uniref:Uncharacterized protein n=1 Tax=Porites evermanni TaxID=104178 RepID=A0ABN8LK07_9CNID|nr:unnamed protein product [Porites evermanni]